MSPRVAATAALLVLLTPSEAWAQGRRKVVVLEDGEVIKGVVQKPEIQILISRQDVSTDDQLVLDESFLSKIVESVEKKPL